VSLEQWRRWVGEVGAALVWLGVDAEAIYALEGVGGAHEDELIIDGTGVRRRLVLRRAVDGTLTIVRVSDEGCARTDIAAVPR